MAFSVGGDVEAYCTTCKMMKDHVIVAMVGDKPAKVECAGCHKQHVYRAGPPGTKPERVPRTRTSRASEPEAPPQATLSEIAAKLVGREGEAKPYSPMTRFALDEVVKHPSFGVGLVTALPAAQKVEIAFPSGRKLLLHDRGAAQPSTLQRPKPREEDDRTPVTDAPPTSTK
jgi:hypothetical protein